MVKRNTIAIDTMILIYLINKNPLYCDGVRECLNNCKKIILSTMGMGEVLAGFAKNNDKDGKLKFLSFLENYSKISVLGFGRQEALIFAQLRSDYPSLKPPDCIHLATAISAGADAFFTHDKKLKKSSPLPIITI